jgi:hypothetical protein
MPHWFLYLGTFLQVLSKHCPQDETILLYDVVVQIFFKWAVESVSFGMDYNLQKENSVLLVWLGMFTKFCKI